jgi:hypothetical protein
METTEERAAKLAADLAEPVSPEELAQVLAFLDEYPAPEPPRTGTEALIERLRPFVPVRSGGGLLAGPRFRSEGISASPTVLLRNCLRAQFRIFRPAWWLGSAVTALLWLLAARAFNWSPSLVVPLLVGGCVAYAFRDARTPAKEMELSCPVRPAHIVLARLVLILGWVTLLGAPVAAVTGGGAASGMWAELSAWGAAMLFCSGLALLGALWIGTPGALAVTALGALAGWLPQAGLWAGAAPWSLSRGGSALVGLVLLAAGLALSGRLSRLQREEG